MRHTRGYLKEGGSISHWSEAARDCRLARRPFIGLRWCMETDSDPFVLDESEAEVDAVTSRILEECVKSADAGRVVPAEQARQRLQEWLSGSSTRKAR